MYNFERRLKLTQKSYEDLKIPQASNTPLAVDGIEVFIMLARTITFVMQKELSKFPDFETWYAPKRIEMKEKFQYLVDLRNTIEKEGESPIKSGTIIIQFHPYTDATEKVGTTTYSDGRTEDTLGKITHVGYFDKEREKEVVASCGEYLAYLEGLVIEAVSRFPLVED